MNILYLTFAYLPTLGGVQRSVHNLAAEFTRRGHRIIIATNGDRPFVYQRVPPAPIFALRIPSPFYWHKWGGIRTHLLDAVNLTALAAVCVSNKIEVVHCHLVNVDTRYAIALKRLLGVKAVITLRGGEFHHWIEGRPARREYLRRLLESADAVTALSQSQMDDARALTPALALDSPIISNPANPEAIRHLAAAGQPFQGEHPYILFCGRLEKEKRLDLLIDAYQGILSEREGFAYDLVVAGDGSLSPVLQERARTGRGGDRIHFLGACGYEDSLALVRDAAMLILPSQESEGCPNVVLEAMALGTPVIASDHGPLVEMVAHGINGEIFPSGDVAALGQRLRSLAENAELRARYAAAGLAYLEQRHGLEKIAVAYEELYRRIL